MDKKRFLELIKQYQTDPASLKSLSEDEAKQFQTILSDRGFALPKFGADGDIGGETTAAIDSYLASEAYTSDIAPVSTTDNATVTDTETAGAPTKTALEIKAEQRLAEEARFAEEEGAAGRFDRDKGLAQRDAYNVVQAGTDIARLSSALSQIKAGKQQREDAVRPQMPMREVSPELQAAHNRAEKRTEKGFTDAERAAHDQQGLYAYSNAIQQGTKQGQASNQAVHAQALHGNKLKQNLQVSVADAQARQANEAYAAQTAQALAQDKDSLYKSSLQYGYAPALQDYRRKMGEAGITERQGRVNMDNLMSVAPYRAANAIGNYYGNKVQRGEETPLQREERRKAWFQNLSNKFRKPNPVNPNATPEMGPPVDAPIYNPQIDIMNDPYYNPEFTV